VGRSDGKLTVPDPILAVDDVVVRFGGLTALSNVAMSVEEGASAGLIGPNGAGKTTLFNVISGFLHPVAGSVRFAGEELTGLAPYQIARRGLVRTFQRARPLAQLTVLENIMAGVFRTGRTGPLGTVIAPRAARREEAATRDRALGLLDHVGLADIADAMPSELTAGQLRLLEIARVLAAEPRMVLLDEPAAGLNRKETAALADIIRRLQGAGITCLLVEHDVELVFAVCRQVTVLDFGEVIARGAPGEVRSDPRVLRSYLGQRDDDVKASKEELHG
jgi:branched-chain amino acid transport system ATP-binding protein